MDGLGTSWHPVPRCGGCLRDLSARSCSCLCSRCSDASVGKLRLSLGAKRDLDARLRQEVAARLADTIERLKGEERTAGEQQTKRLQRLRVRREAARARLELVNCELSCCGEALYQRKEKLKQSLRALETERTTQLKHVIPEVLRVTEIQYGAVREQLEKQQRRVLKDLCIILPLKKLAQSDKQRQSEYYSARGECLSICGCVLPQVEELTSFPPDEVASALGYLLQFLNLCSRYLGIPSLHSGAFAASTSAIWPFASQWSTRSLPTELPLYLIPPTIQINETLQHYLDSGIGAAVSAFGSPQGMHPSGWRRNLAAVPKTKKAVRLLLRSASLLCYMEWTRAGVSPPLREFSPLSALASLCQGLVKAGVSRQQAALASMAAINAPIAVEQSLLLIRDVDIDDATPVERANSNDTEWYWVDEFESLPPLPDCPDSEIEDYGKHRANVNRRRQLSRLIPSLANQFNARRGLDLLAGRSSADSSSLSHPASASASAPKRSPPSKTHAR
mmetsp:Transcript_8152/g.30072  ORF Transcript_8152/g.30072 Transcript_8152/m.30072 type:complete len:505 (-) Transcript_8152:129-1643(-)